MFVIISHLDDEDLIDTWDAYEFPLFAGLNYIYIREGILNHNNNTWKQVTEFICEKSGQISEPSYENSRHHMTSRLNPL